MSMARICPFVCVFLLINLTFINVYFVNVECVVCGDAKILNSPNELKLLENCTRIQGYLEIVLMERTDNPGEFRGISLPKLHEISDFLIVYRVFNLISLSELLPSLTVIRGAELFHENAVVLWGNPHLREIGLTNLTRIERGGVSINFNEKLCYADRINWTHIGASSVNISTQNKEYCMSRQDCPQNCQFCWNHKVCQRLNETDGCHPECFGCSQNYSAKHCYTCKNYKIVEDGDIKECARTCPKHLLMHNYSMSCVTKDACTSLFNGIRFGDSCVDSCPAEYTPTPERNNCIYCGDDCIVHCAGTVVKSKAILDKMPRCTHINGPLEIRISDPTLEDLLQKRLGFIREINGTLKISRSVIRSLKFFSRLEVIRGESKPTSRSYKTLLIDGNPNLQTLFNHTSINSLSIYGEIGIYYNDLLCYSAMEELAAQKNVNITEEDLEVFRLLNGNEAACKIIDMNITITQRNPTNITIVWKEIEKNDVRAIGYTFYYTQTDETNITSLDSKAACDARGWTNFFVTNNSIEIIQLFAYTQYAFYIKTNVDRKTVSSASQTPIHYFRTLSDDPTEPEKVIAKAESDSSIILTWKKPERINGELSYYMLSYFLEPDYYPSRNYCRHEHTDDDKEKLQPPVKQTLAIDNSNCSCTPQEEIRIFQKDVMHLCQKPGYDLYDQSCYNYIYSARKFGLHKREVTLLSTNETSGTYKIFGNDSCEVTNLRHFSLYIFFLSACNNEHCGPVVMTSERTAKSYSADYIVTHDVDVQGNKADIIWTPSNKSNSFIVAYKVAKQRMDLAHSVPIITCITSTEFEANKKITYESLSPGNYSVKVQVISLSGPGLASVAKFFTIEAPGNQLGIQITLTILFVVVTVIVTSVAVYYWKKKHTVDNIHLITSINPDYAGPAYIEDDWELNREDIKIGETVGRGSFGLVYQGNIISRNNYPCAIKTVNEGVSMATRMEFLCEGSRMKSVSDAHHVVKLLGIVSRGQPPLVIMEYMERGDLKSFLRRCREPSQNLTTNEMNRMAAEIADGMAYLAAKKFVHRDLAARNCMVTADLVVKIGDFGMARDIYETDYYRKETVGLLPVRWMAPESLADGVFTSDSDCWSYGVVLYEMATLSQQPYQGMSNEEVFHHVKRGGKLSRPPDCSDTFYRLMVDCWAWRPADRPTFRDIVLRLADIVGETFRLVSFTFSQQGMDHALHAGPRSQNPPALASTRPQEEDFYSHYNVAEEQVDLVAGEPSRPNRLLPFSKNQRQNQSYHFDPNAPSCSGVSYSLDDS